MPGSAPRVDSPIRPGCADARVLWHEVLYSAPATQDHAWAGQTERSSPPSSPAAANTKLPSPGHLEHDAALTSAPRAQEVNLSEPIWTAVDQQHPVALVLPLARENPCGDTRGSRASYSS